jgi:hypothetical protein
MPNISLLDYARLRTWTIQIAKELLPPESRLQDRGPEVQFTHSNGLSICKKNGWWYAFVAGAGGRSTIKLIEYLGQYSRADAVTWAQAWLASHDGTGDCGNDDDDDSASEAAAAVSKTRVEEILKQAGPADGTVVATYLNKRRINVPLPGSIKHSPDARIGESALVAVLHARGVDVGIHCIYIDAFGRKSLRRPEKQTFLADRTRGKGAVCVLQENKDATLPILLAEGVEDGLSLIAAGRTETIWTVPGVGALQHVEVPSGRKVIVVRDGDPAGSPPDYVLSKGLDHLLLDLGDDAVRVTETPLEADANSILTSGNDGEAELNALVDAAVPATLSIDGEVERLARLYDSTDPRKAREFARLRNAVKQKYQINFDQLDRLIKAARPKNPGQDEPPKASIIFPEYPPWDGPPMVLAQMLDELAVTLRKFIVAPDEVLTTIALWAAMTHLVHHTEIRLETAPRLHFSGPPSSGKTTALDATQTLSPRGLLASSVSAAAVLRGMSALKPTLCVDEIDNVLLDKNSDLLGILNASHRRRTAGTMRCVPTPEGGWETKEFDVWGAICSAGVDPLPPTQQTRAITLGMQVALVKDIPEQLEDGTAPKLIELHRQLIAWAAALHSLPKPVLPAVLAQQPGRVADLWRPLVAIAEPAGGVWPARVAAAIAANLKAERLPGMQERVLISLRRAFDMQAYRDQKKSPAVLERAPDNPARLTTPTLVERFCQEVDEEWSTANRGHPVNSYFLRRMLQGLLDPPGAQDWYTGPNHRRTHQSGYLRSQLERAWATILRLPPDLSMAQVEVSPSDHPPPSGAPGASGAPFENTEFSDEASGARAPDPSGAPASAGNIFDAGAPDASGAPAPDTNKKTSTKSPGAPDTPDAPDPQEGAGERRPRRGDATPGGTQPKRVVSRSAGLVAQAICDLADAHPGWSEAQIAREVGQPVARVQRTLAGRQGAPHAVPAGIAGGAATAVPVEKPPARTPGHG